MNNEFKKTQNKNQTVYTLESASAGATSSGSVASASMPVGNVRRRGQVVTSGAEKKVPASTPRNFVAKNAKTGGAGAHKDKKKSEKQGSVKHKKAFMEDHSDVTGGYGQGSYDTYAGGNHGRGVAEQDHEIQMASSELQSIGKNAEALLNMVRKYSEQQGLEAWQQSKITKAADYLNSVLQSISGEQSDQGVAEGSSDKGMDAYKKGAGDAHNNKKETNPYPGGTYDHNSYKSGYRTGLAHKEPGVAEGLDKETLRQELIKINQQMKLNHPRYNNPNSPGHTDRYFELMKKRDAIIAQLKQGVAEGEKTMSRAAKGIEKYGKDGMRALAKAGRDGASEKKLDTIRDRHDNYNEGLAEGSMDEIHGVVSQMMDKYIAKYQNGLLDADHLGSIIHKVAEKVSQQYKIEHNDAMQMVSNYVEGEVGDDTDHAPDVYMESLHAMLERSVSQAQHNLMVGVAHNPQFAQKVNVKQQVGQEFTKADVGKDISKLPVRVPKKK